MKNRSLWLVGFGFLLGTAVGIGMLAGSLATRLAGPSSADPLPPDMVRALHASSTHGGENFAMATSLIDETSEAVFFLDYLTGDLSGLFLNRHGQPGVIWKHNVVADLGIDQGKKPRYLLVTGVNTNFVRGAGLRPANCVIYVADANTGRFVGYSVMLDRNQYASGRGHIGRVVPIVTGAARNLELRGE